ncbi:MAG: 4-carboxymuconolactone decarboxylase [Alphaproteobacteria bacterium]|nr:4-carboxymuconolactone decarboxylase [Alphaproteobacteria bacterium]
MPKRNEELYQAGLKVRREVLGDQYVMPQINAAETDPVAKTLQDMVTEYCWGFGWTDGKLDRKTRSLMTLCILTALDKPQEIKAHTRGALNNGLTREEIAEALRHATIYCGIPAGVNAFRNFREALAEIDAKKK